MTARNSSLSPPPAPRLRLSFVAGLLLHTAFAPLSAETADLCFGEAEATHRVIIDANSGEVINGLTHFPPRTPIAVVVTRKNPFKYAYAVGIEVEPIPDLGLLSDFFGLVTALGPVQNLLSPEESDDMRERLTPTEAPPPTPASGAPPRCQGPDLSMLNRFTDDFRLRLSEAEELRRRVSALHQNYAATRKKYDDFLKATGADSLSYDACKAVIEEIGPTRQALALFDIGELPVRVKSHAHEVDRLAQLTTYFRPENPACVPRHQELLVMGQGLAAQSRGLTTAVERAGEGAKSFPALVEQIDRTLGTPSSFFEKRTIAGRRRHSKVTIEIERTPLRFPEPKTESRTVELEIGQPAFSLSVGPGVSTIGESTIDREIGLVSDGAAGQVLGPRFAITHESDLTPLGAVLLNANLWSSKKKDRTFALSAGLSLGEGDEASAVGYLFGPSLAWLDNRFYITLAYHLREVDVLGGGFQEGDPIPMDLGDSLPIRKTTDEGLMLVLSYKVR